MSETQRCTKCGRVLPLSEFYRTRNTRGEIVPRRDCKDCKNLYNAIYNAKHRAERNAYHRDYARRYRQAHGDPTCAARVKRHLLRKALRHVQEQASK